MNEQPPPQFDMPQILGLLSALNGNGSPAPDTGPAPNTTNFSGAFTNNTQTDMNALLMKFLLNGGLQRLLTPKPKAPEPTRTVNLDNYIRID